MLSLNLPVLVNLPIIKPAESSSSLGTLETMLAMDPLI